MIKEDPELGRSSFKYARVLDKLKAERERIYHHRYCSLEVRNPTLSLILPATDILSRHPITCTSQADRAVPIIVDGSADISKDDQTREHALLAFTLGIRQWIVAINKIPSSPKLVITELSRSQRKLVSTPNM